ncbi:hypothetical protein BCR41DRAFT_422931 [Lobosporangium transversale]|uniref:CCHC-type domain-containing protein n=1 Tax=Lobosporangium transversale TaxID=64571 RepID=A0A1Y2G8A5_9FUNG|nr:hypothetical protein BCR41DRAFT_426101 [Lobosporangium transversale]XP_021880503.1 hypothetical protein BCR41DRAFT_422931 [Lobosporangium transversale]ORZ04075.1 hypothetical protein BCR41DRAFT_426101 [Lobosporangium transversale]ORZ13422.1 hypothetical protein BCR41DRAFT_422931 [Lobosporangium transversale]|eukprot:XP_021876352.1 hypothetical protein BCR41DRAFT_426101 [Lobosporangium transversale]
MADRLPPPSPPPSSSNEVDEGHDPLAQAGDVVKNNKIKQSLSFAEMARKSLSKKEVQTSWNALRKNAVVRAFSTEVEEHSVFFTPHHAPTTFAVKYDRKTHLVSDVVEAIRLAFPKAVGLDPVVPGVVVVLVRTQKEVDEAIASPPLPCNPAPVRAYHTVHSTGSRLRIRVDRITLSTPEDRLEYIKNIFGKFGRVIHTKFHYVKGSETLLLPSFEFVLELSGDSPRDLLIPRVAQAEGINTLFHWYGPQYCYKCGEENHVKQSCPQPPEFDLLSAPKRVIMARAFLPANAPARAPPAVPQAPKATKGPKVNKDTPSSDKEEWTTVTSTKRKKAAKRTSSRSTGSTSASESDVPRKKITARKLNTKESTSVPAPVSSGPTQQEPTVLIEEIKVADAAASSSSSTQGATSGPADTHASVDQSPEAPSAAETAPLPEPLSVSSTDAIVRDEEMDLTTEKTIEEHLDSSSSSSSSSSSPAPPLPVPSAIPIVEDSEMDTMQEEGSETVLTPTKPRQVSGKAVSAVSSRLKRTFVDPLTVSKASRPSRTPTAKNNDAR